MTMLHLTEERLLELIDMKADELFAAIDEIKADPIQKNWVDADRIEELEVQLAKALTALVEIREFVKDLEPYAEQGHTLVPALQKACLTLAELTGEKK